MRTLAILLGTLLLLEGGAKQLRPKQWVRWLASEPLAYMPEPVLRVSWEYADLSIGALRLLGLLELAAGATILSLATAIRPCKCPDP